MVMKNLGQHFFFLLHFLNKFSSGVCQVESVGDNADNVVGLRVYQTGFFQLLKRLDKITLRPGDTGVRSLESINRIEICNFTNYSLQITYNF